jgi:hypothetical protein
VRGTAGLRVGGRWVEGVVVVEGRRAVLLD